MPIGTLQTHHAMGEVTIPSPKQEAPRAHPRQTRNLITRPYFRKTYTSHERVPVRIEHAKKEGSGNTEICTNLSMEDTPRGKWDKVLLTTKGNRHELRLKPKEFTYQYIPIIRMALKDRLQKQKKLLMPEKTTKRTDPLEKQMELAPNEQHQNQKQMITKKPPQEQKSKEMNKQQKQKQQARRKTSDRRRR